MFPELPEAEMPLQRALRTGQTTPILEGKLERTDKTTVDAMVTATPLFDDNKTVRGAIAAILTQTEALTNTNSHSP